MSGLSNGSGLNQGFGLYWINGLYGGPGLQETYTQSAPTNITVPTITGPALVGTPEVGSNGSWTGSPNTFAYQWNSDGTPIGGATSINYTPVSGDIGHVLTLTVTATNSTGDSSPATSAGSPTVAASLGGQAVGVLLGVTH